MKIYKQIRLFYLISGLSIAVLITFGLIFMERNKSQVKYIDAVEHTYKVLSAINFCEKVLLEAETSQRGYLLTKDTNYLGLLRSNLPLIDSSLQKIGSFTASTNSQGAFYDQLTKYVQIRVKILQNNLNLKDTDALSAEHLRAGAVAMEYCRFYMGKMRRVEENLLASGMAQKNRFQRLNESLFKTTFIISCMICILAIVIFFRELGIRLTTQRTLRSKVVELSNSKRELEEITFAASHDLQEPMRKIRILGNLFTKKFSGKVSGDDLEVVERISRITEQMHSLLNDLVLYTNLLNPNEKHADVNLYNAFKNAYYKVFKDEDVNLQMPPKLPVINGSQAHIEIMLVNILENALRFKNPDKELSLTVSYELKPVKESKYFWDHLSSKEYHQVTITDNGIGFDKQYSDKIFGLFQRLHTHTEYPGKGIGLSIAKRVMTNHKGYISATGEKMAGASFILYFPKTK